METWGRKRVSFCPTTPSEPQRTRMHYDSDRRRCLTEELNLANPQTIRMLSPSPERARELKDSRRYRKRDIHISVTFPISDIVSTEPATVIPETQRVALLSVIPYLDPVTFTAVGMTCKVLRRRCHEIRSELYAFTMDIAKRKPSVPAVLDRFASIIHWTLPLSERTVASRWGPLAYVLPLMSDPRRPGNLLILSLMVGHIGWLRHSLASPYLNHMFKYPRLIRVLELIPTAWFRQLAPLVADVAETLSIPCYGPGYEIESVMAISDLLVWLQSQMHVRLRANDSVARLSVGFMCMTSVPRTDWIGRVLAAFSDSPISRMEWDGSFTVVLRWDGRD